MGAVQRVGGRIVLTRMGFLVCMDGFPEFHQKRKGAISLMPDDTGVKELLIVELYSNYIRTISLNSSNN